MATYTVVLYIILEVIKKSTKLSPFWHKLNILTIATIQKIIDFPGDSVAGTSSS